MSGAYQTCSDGDCWPDTCPVCAYACQDCDELDCVCCNPTAEEN